MDADVDAYAETARAEAAYDVQEASTAWLAGPHPLHPCRPVAHLAYPNPSAHRSADPCPSNDLHHHAYPRPIPCRLESPYQDVDRAHDPNFARDGNHLGPYDTAACLPCLSNGHDLPYPWSPNLSPSVPGACALQAHHGKEYSIRMAFRAPRFHALPTVEDSRSKAFLIGRRRAHLYD